MKESSGVIIYDGKNILGCIPFGKMLKTENNLDLPKGKIESGESPVRAAIRECWEETGIQLKKDDLIYKGVYLYKSDKKLHIFIARMKIPEISTLTCVSMLEMYGKQVPEMVGYKIVPKEEIEKSFFKGLVSIILDNVR